MNYSVELNSEVNSTIQSWNLPSPVIREILARMDRLGTGPVSLLNMVPPPVDRLEYSFEFRDHGPPKRDHLFVFWVLYSADEETLLVLDCLHLWFDCDD